LNDSVASASTGSELDNNGNMQDARINIFASSEGFTVMERKFEKYSQIEQSGSTIKTAPLVGPIF
jgi:hypothetical protein